MGWLAVFLASTALMSLAFPNAGVFVAMGLAIFATALGFVSYRRTSSTGWMRLTGAAGATLGAIALLLSSVKYGVTLAALSRLEGML